MRFCTCATLSFALKAESARRTAERNLQIIELRVFFCAARQLRHHLAAPVRADQSETAELSRTRLPYRTGEGALRPLLPHRRFIKLRQARAGRRGLRPVLARHYYGTQAKGA